MSLTQRVYWRIHQFWHRYHEARSLAALNAFDSDLVPAMRAVTEAAGLEDFRCTRQSAELLEALLTYRPKRIVELGSGRSTLLLAAYAKSAPGTEVLSFEQDRFWRDTVNTVALDHFDMAPSVHADVELTREGGRYRRDIPPGSDFLYVDGPHIDAEARYESRFGKAVYEDVPDFIAKGGTPDVILCEGRLDTVNAILKSGDVASRYAFSPSFFWHYFLDKAQNPFRYAWHCRFVRHGAR